MPIDFKQLKEDLIKLNSQIEELNFSYKNFDQLSKFIIDEVKSIDNLRNSLYTTTRIFSNLKKKKRKLNLQEKISTVCLLKRKKIQEKDFVNNQLKPELTEICSNLPTVDKNEDETIKLSTEFKKTCYICKTKFSELHFFYDLLCGPCANLSYEKRQQKFDFTGKIAVVTGCRIKIGYQICLFLLRNNCTVIGTSRFPKDAFLRISKEEDFQTFKHLIRIYPLDLRDIRAVDKFVTYLYSNFDKLDILINNAAQTLRHSTQFYKHLLDIETKPLVSFNDEDIYKILPFQEIEVWTKNTSTVMLEEQNNNSNNQVSLINNDVSFSFIQSQLPILDVDFNPDMSKFPTNVLDKDHQQVDLTEKNSWKLEIDDLNIFEFAETQLINSFSPFYLCSKLKKLMSNGVYESRYIVNVSSMEGKFDRRFKSTQHCHTNMSKASLNMMTRTCGRYFALSKIYMTCVDTGWVSEMNPFNLFKYDRTVPLDEIDGAMRVLDPIIKGYSKNIYMHSIFLKDYNETTW